ncbi:hypothetical protein [Pseudofulvibacter geojedonensis]|uniref:Outer membrane protein beta-barrel domain-containing protein n=1 Tax=Pseudofulvibacter geojedonensis TaxID=1123758 RepID=A0ABW3HZA8_9FLAO
MFLFTTIAYGQNIDFESFGKGKALKVSGGISANSVFYNANQQTGREAFTYFLQGNLNLSLYQFSMPISYSYSNQGALLNYNVPFKFNRFSLHPKYKWFQGHIGDVTMNFSPYTLNGHLFTGGGVELTPKGKFKVSAMGGRLLRATEDDDEPNTIPAFTRMGYGLNVGYEHNKLALNVIGFYAKDQMNSISTIPEEKGVTPKENLVVSLGGAYKISEDLDIIAEYASTAITQDLRAEDSSNGEGLASLLFNDKSSTEYHKAIKAGFNYSFKKATLGVTYERIDPGYETLGAYFFNNDFENITLNSTTMLLKDKLSLSFNIGYQRDNLEKQKEQSTNRTVGSVNASYTASERLTLTAMYSNFTTFTNARLDQFETINDDNLLDNANEQFDYKQLSQNANINVNYILAKSEKNQQNLNVNYALADVSNEQNGIVRIGNASTFHNANVSYSLVFPKKKTAITTAINGTVNTIEKENATTWGPTLGVNKKFLDNKLNTGFAASYNSSTSKTSFTSVTNFRINANYVYKDKHNFNLNGIQLFRNSTSNYGKELTITFGYNYSF